MAQQTEAEKCIAKQRYIALTYCIFIGQLDPTAADLVELLQLEVVNGLKSVRIFQEYPVVSAILFRTYDSLKPVSSQV